MHISTTAAVALLVQLFFVNEPSQAHAAQCETIKTFDDLIRIVNMGMTLKRNEICFRPFRLIKASASVVVLNRPISLRCDKLLNNEKCIIEGGGSHITIAGGNAKVKLDGFTFTGATQGAVRVTRTSRETHYLTGCEFVR
jgi:hypothetical protein